MDDNDIVIVNGIPRPRWAVEAVDKFLALVTVKPMWEVIDFIVSVYLRKHPEFLKKANVSMINQYASTKDKSMRSLLSIPADLKDTIEFLYKDEIQDIGPLKFWRKFAKKYPNFSLAEKI